MKSLMEEQESIKNKQRIIDEKIKELAKKSDLDLTLTEVNYLWDVYGSGKKPTVKQVAIKARHSYSHLLFFLRTLEQKSLIRLSPKGNDDNDLDVELEKSALDFIEKISKEPIKEF